jgi:hypothetical protein
MINSLNEVEIIIESINGWLNLKKESVTLKAEHILLFTREATRKEQKKE